MCVCVHIEYATERMHYIVYIFMHVVDDCLNINIEMFQVLPYSAKERSHITKSQTLHYIIHRQCFTCSDALRPGDGITTMYVIHYQGLLK